MFIHNQYLQELFGFILIITGIYDGWKYIWLGKAIKKAKSAKSQSRKAINAAIINDVFRTIYGIILLDWFIILSSVFAFLTMVYCWWQLYLHYPYEQYPKTKTIIIKRPNIFTYVINSFLPNSKRKHL